MIAPLIRGHRETRSFQAVTRIGSASFLLFLLLLTTLLALPSVASAETWSKVSTDGFGSVTNQRVQLGQETFGGYIYSGTGMDFGPGGEIWRSSDGSSWAQVGSAGFGDSNNTYVSVGPVFGGNLYATTYNPTTGGEIWRSANGTAWSLMTDDGFGSPTNAESGLMVFGSYLYAGTGNGGASGGQLWRSSDGVNWTQIEDAGFGDVNNTSIWPLAVSGGYLYVSGQNSVTGGEVWRSSDGTSFTQVNVDGFGDANNRGITSGGDFGGYVYVGTRNDVDGGEIWRSSNGTVWSQVGTSGFGSTNNQRVKVMGDYADSYLYFKADSNVGLAPAELWRTEDGTTYSQVNADGFGDANNTQIPGDLSVLNGSIYVSTRNTVAGGSVWRSAAPVPDEPALAQTGLDAWRLGLGVGVLFLGGLLAGMTIRRRYRPHLYLS